jgi:hypothetical protein
MITPYKTMARTRILRRVLELKYEGKRHMGQSQTKQQIRQQKTSGTMKNESKREDCGKIEETEVFCPLTCIKLK